ncbi:Pycsar system effector family protein [Nocardiopsis sp. HUAS JQ3]|uniref:Pycsar system effector family protein n=1 Tax=Nocardiopsis sp. HUAS JQ3 TaxID=3061629 RepID=UPI0023A99922|nr:Pycsar system effector family protein [Nocardiopsis sp. HUAS JQ3]WDZ90665.1 DUF5706 domain-containing protein [Nocardiopsis sp. HUAS JQ3]
MARARATAARWWSWRQNEADEDVRRYTFDLLSDTRDEIGRADQKAAILLAASGVAASILSASVLDGRWAPTGLSPFSAVLWWIGSASGACAMVAFTLAVFPKTRDRTAMAHPNLVRFYDDVLRINREDRLEQALRWSSTMELQRLIGQLKTLSAIAVRKYRLIQVGTVAMATAVTGHLVAGLVQLL